MDFSTNYADRTREIISLFKATFTACEGAEEGDLIGSLVDRMLAETDVEDIFVFSALEGDALAGAAIFTRVRYPQDTRTVFILSPMAVVTAQQGKGIGQKLLTFSLNILRQSGVDVALTYGDINFYSKVGFEQILETIAEPPLRLSYPEGWLGQSLTGKPLDLLQGPSTCVNALNDPAIW